jgi:hypothetical protein
MLAISRQRKIVHRVLHSLLGRSLEIRNGAVADGVIRRRLIGQDHGIDDDGFRFPEQAFVEIDMLLFMGQDRKIWTASEGSSLAR